MNDDFTYDTSKIEAFLLPANTAVEIYATTLHYAPCNAKEDGFRCVVVLPKDTNLELDTSHKTEGEDKLLTAKNKWLIAHKDSGLEGQAFIGLIGENISVQIICMLLPFFFFISFLIILNLDLCPLPRTKSPGGQSQSRDLIANNAYPNPNNSKP